MKEPNGVETIVMVITCKKCCVGHMHELVCHLILFYRMIKYSSS